MPAAIQGPCDPTRTPSKSRSDRRLALLTSLATAAALLCSPAAAAQAEFFPPESGRKMSESPNIVLITGDHLRWDHIAANGNAAIITPSMDRLAREGTTFRASFTVGVACAPNRASLMTAAIRMRTE